MITIWQRDQCAGLTNDQISPSTGCRIENVAGLHSMQKCATYYTKYTLLARCPVWIALAN
jgi:hypothetical protein